MNGRDLERMVRATFGECPGCGDCNSCRVLGMVQMAWDTGVRSGSAGAAERKKNPLFSEWDWEAEWPTLMKYVRGKRFGDDIAGASAFVTEVHETATDWALQTAGAPPRRPNWTSFLKLWLGKELARLRPLPELQTDLFRASSATSSVVSRSSMKIAARREGALRILAGGKSRPS